MVVKPMIRNNISMTAHPVGCRRMVEQQIAYVRDHGSIAGPKRVLVLGSSTGYGLASRIVSAFGSGASTIGVGYEAAPKGNRTGSAGWYMQNAFDELAAAEGLAAHSLNADAFAHQTRKEVIERAGHLDGPIDLVVYSLASPVRVDPDTGEMYRSQLKPIRERYTSFVIDIKTGEMRESSIEPATEEDVAATIKVMGGEDWKLWIEALSAAGVLAPDAMTVAYSYIGPDLTYPVYRDGTIGRAKEHLEATAHELNAMLAATGGRAWVSVNKALMTRASAVIPGVAPYIAILYRVMKDAGVHEGTIEQIYRLFSDRLYGGGEPAVDDAGRIRVDELELRADIQAEVARRWQAISQDALEELADVEGIRREFMNIHGFDIDGVDYDADVEV